MTDAKVDAFVKVFLQNREKREALEQETNPRHIVDQSLALVDEYIEEVLQIEGVQQATGIASLLNALEKSGLPLVYSDLGNQAPHLIRSRRSDAISLGVFVGGLTTFGKCSRFLSAGHLHGTDGKLKDRIVAMATRLGTSTTALAPVAHFSFILEFVDELARKDLFVPTSLEKSNIDNTVWLVNTSFKEGILDKLSDFPEFGCRLGLDMSNGCFFGAGRVLKHWIDPTGKISAPSATVN